MKAEKQRVIAPLQCRGLLFDLDGTLVDSLPAVERAWRGWAERQGREPKQVLNFIHGKPALTSLRHFMSGESESAIMREYRWLEALEMNDTQGVVPLPGVLTLLNQLQRWGTPWGIVTSGSHGVAYARYHAACLPRPAVFITAEQVLHGKPEPDGYLLGVERLGLTPGECVVVEDSIAGVHAGLAADCQVIALCASDTSMNLPGISWHLSTLTQVVARCVDSVVTLSLRTP